MHLTLKLVDSTRCMRGTQRHNCPSSPLFIASSSLHPLMSPLVHPGMRCVTGIPQYVVGRQALLLPTSQSTWPTNTSEQRVAVVLVRTGTVELQPTATVLHSGIEREGIEREGARLHWKTTTVNCSGIKRAQARKGDPQPYCHTFLPDAQPRTMIS